MEQLLLEAAKQAPIAVVLLAAFIYFLKYIGKQADSNEERIKTLCQQYDKRIEALYEQYAKQEQERNDRVTSAFKDAVTGMTESTKMLGVISAYLQVLAERKKDSSQ